MSYDFDKSDPNAGPWVNPSPTFEVIKPSCQPVKPRSEPSEPETVNVVSSRINGREFGVPEVDSLRKLLVAAMSAETAAEKNWWIDVLAGVLGFNFELEVSRGLFARGTPPT